MEFKFTVDKLNDLKNMIIDSILKSENIHPEDLEFQDIFYYSGLKKWTCTASFEKNSRVYNVSIDILENGLITRYQQRCENGSK